MESQVVYLDGAIVGLDPGSKDGRHLRGTPGGSPCDPGSVDDSVRRSRLATELCLAEPEPAPGPPLAEWAPTLQEGHQGLLDGLHDLVQLLLFVFKLDK